MGPCVLAFTFNRSQGIYVGIYVRAEWLTGSIWVCFLYDKTDIGRGEGEAAAMPAGSRVPIKSVVKCLSRTPV